jgi:hypothetical protein
MYIIMNEEEHQSFAPFTNVKTVKQVALDACEKDGKARVVLALVGTAAPEKAQWVQTQLPLQTKEYNTPLIPEGWMTKKPPEWEEVERK